MRGIFIGRFQPFHVGHEKLLKTGVSYSGLQEMLIAIANIEQIRTLSNPFTYAERVNLIHAAILGLSQEIQSKISVIPLPYATPPERFAPSIIDQFGPLDLVLSNNEWVRKQFRQFSQVPLHPKIFFDRDQYRGGKIRSFLEKGDLRWKTAVPAPVAQYLERIHVERIITQLKTSRLHSQGKNHLIKGTSEPIRGTIISGTQVAGRYVQTPHFFQALTRYLGAEPYPGTLNLRLNEGYSTFRRIQQSREPFKIPPRFEGNVGYWNVDCYPALLQNDAVPEWKVYVVAIDFGSQKPGVDTVELLAHPHLRSYLNLRDGDVASFSLL